MKEECGREDKFGQAARMIMSCRRIVCFTGAGASTDSGLPDYRGIGTAYWEKYDPKDFTYDRFLSFQQARINYWRMEQEFYCLVKRAQPNGIHRFLVKLAGMGKLQAIITQNVDGLHQKAGTSPDKVIEIHGSIFTVTCLSCRKKYSREDIYGRISSGVAVPTCGFCYGILKTDTVAFGQPIPELASSRAIMAALQCDLFIVIGSSLLVQPASYLVIKAKEAGAKVVIINLSPTPYDLDADLVIYENAQAAMLRIMEKVTM